jgi:hypothetical protein
MPDPALRKLNFTVTFGASVQRRISKKRVLSIGYLGRQTSDARRSSENPGMKSTKLQIGLGIIRFASGRSFTGCLAVVAALFG